MKKVAAYFAAQGISRLRLLSDDNLLEILRLSPLDVEGPILDELLRRRKIYESQSLADRVVSPNTDV